MPTITTNIYQASKNILIKNRRIVVATVHLLQAAIANYLAFVLRFESILIPKYLDLFLTYLPFLLMIRLVFYLQAGLHKGLWRYSSTEDLIKIVWSTTLGSLVFVIIVRYLFGDTEYPRSIYVLDWLLLIMISGGSRLFMRIFREHLHTESLGKKILLVGAGDAGEMIVRDMKNNPKYAYKPIGFIDDDPYKAGLSIHGVPIFGPKKIIGEVIEKHKPEEILISIPSARYKTIKEIYELCKLFNIPIKVLPGLSDILDGNVSVSQIKPLSLEDLLQRDPVEINIKPVRDHINGRSVLVTGAGGSIGSELCRQLIKYSPSNLILFDRYENGLFEIDLELKRDRSLTPLISTIVGDMCDINSLEYLFLRHKPSIVFHAAAHKHVPLMETNLLEVVKNNIFGTKNLLDTALKHNSENFVMISTDKAVNPSNIMGATKRITEFLTINMNSSSRTKCTVVRFGNVLGSNGSVVHVFKEQLKYGGPLTVTHPEIKRFFMLIPEAVQLVLTSAASSAGGEINVLNMGEQIKIVDLAENLIRLSGFIPYEDIKIEFTGLRLGEKLYEELFDVSEKIIPTLNKKLSVAVPDNVPSMEMLAKHISILRHIVSNNSVDEIIPEIQKIVPNFKKDEK